jgi:hypothetical protein
MTPADWIVVLLLLLVGDAYWLLSLNLPLWRLRRSHTQPWRHHDYQCRYQSTR